MSCTKAVIENLRLTRDRRGTFLARNMRRLRAERRLRPAHSQNGAIDRFQTIALNRILNVQGCECATDPIAATLCLLLPVNHAPTLRSNDSVDVFAGRGGFKQLAIVAALLPLRRVLILHDLLRHLGRLRGRRCADDCCRGCDRCPGGAGRDGQNMPPGNS